MSTFETQMAKTALTEGGYVNDPSDRGGETNHGVTVAVARAFGYQGPMRALTKSQALEIYRARYWMQPGFDLIDAISPEVAAWLLDTGKMLQRALNGLNDQQSRYPDLTVDGLCGAMTRHALTQFLAYRGAEGAVVLVRMLRAMQMGRYLEIAEGNQTQERFLYGWARRALLA
jgi:lysozyme family protein